jgi:hypothetical protein
MIEGDMTSQRESSVFFEENDLLRPTALAGGPWYEGTQHGSAMMLMAGLAAERHPADEPRQVTRLTVDMMKAAPLAPLQTVVTTRKRGRHMEVLDISIRSDGDEFVRASALRFAISDTPVVDRLKFGGPAPVLPEPDDFELLEHMVGKPGFHNAIELRVDVSKQPAVLWVRLKKPVLPGLFATPLLRVMLAADWTYAIPNIAHRAITRSGYAREGFYGINPDTTVNLHRYPEGEWVGIQAQATYGDHGAGTVGAQIFDLKGAIGFSSQSILLRAL